MRFILPTALLFWVYGSLPLLAESETDRATIEAIHKAYKANLAALNSHGSLTFAYYHGLIENSGDPLPEELATRPRKRLSEGHGRYIFTGKKRLYDHSYPFDVHRNNSHKTARGYIEMIFSYRWVTDGDQVIIDDIHLLPDAEKLRHKGTIRSSINRMWIDGYLETPINPGRNGQPGQFSIEKVIPEHLTNSRKWTLLELNENASVGETQTTKIVLASLQQGLTWQCWVDRARGSIPLRLHVTGKEHELIHGEENWDLRSPGQGVWIPFHWLDYSRAGNRSADAVNQNAQSVPIGFNEGEIESADLDVTPVDSEFYLDFPEAISIQNTDGGPTYPASTRWDLNSISPEATAAALRLPINEKLVYRPPTRWFPWLPEREWWQNGLLLLAISLFGLYSFYVYRSKRKSVTDRGRSANR